MDPSAKEPEKIDTNPITLTRWVLDQEPETATGDMTIMLASIQLAVKAISTAIRRAGIAKLFGLAGQQNETGDDQKKLDVLSNELFKNALRFSHTCALMVSEEDPEAEVIQRPGKYIIAFDPLDGSSNIDANVSVGTIFGVWRQAVPGAIPKPEDAIRKGDDIVCGGYALYGSSTMLVLTLGQGVVGFTLDPSLGEFILTHPDIRIPERGKIYSINEGYADIWTPDVTNWINSLKFPTDPRKKPYSARYVGSMVADVHRTLLYGGVYAYPGTKKSADGKLRYLYEVAPMAFLVEQAGGRSINGTGGRSLDHTPKTIHERQAIFLGSKLDIDDVEGFMKPNATTVTAPPPEVDPSVINANTVVLVTGASTGIGREAAKKFAAAGCKVVITARRLGKLNEVRDSILQATPGAQVHVATCDVREMAQVKAVADGLPEGWKDVDVIVNNAGLSRNWAPTWEHTEDDIDTVMLTNVKGLHNFFVTFVPGMKERGRGHLITVSSIAGVEAYANGSTYAASKHAAHGLTIALRKELVGTNLRVSMVSPGLVDTEEFSLVRFGGDADKAKSVYNGITALHDVDVADAIFYTASRPPHVQVADLQIYPTAQASVDVVFKKK